jgi:hypothetical protein
MKVVAGDTMTCVLRHRVEMTEKITLWLDSQGGWSVKLLGDAPLEGGIVITKWVFLALMLLGLAEGALAQKLEITEKPDPALGVKVLAPKEVSTIGVNQGLLKMDRINWRVYPIIYQKLDEKEKQAVLKVDIVGPVGFTNAPLTVNIDGQVTTIPVTWTYVKELFYNHVSANIALRDGTFRKFVAATEVYLTVVLPESTDRYTVRLTSENLGVFRTMLDKYDDLEPKPDTSK